MASEQQSSRPILVVDDDATIRDYLARILGQEGYAVHGAAHGQEALDELRGGLRPCMILLDLATPVMSGWEFLIIQRRDPALAAIPVVTLSAFGDVGPDAAALGVAACLEKPIALDHLLATVRVYCPGR